MYIVKGVESVMEMTHELGHMYSNVDYNMYMFGDSESKCLEPTKVMYARALSYVNGVLASGSVNTQFVWDARMYTKESLRSEIANYVLQNTVKQAVSDDVGRNLSIDYFIDIEFLNHYLCRIIDSSGKSALYTTSLSLIEYLCKTGHILNADKTYDRMKKELSPMSNRFKKAFTEKTVFAARLDVESTGSNYQLNVKLPKRLNFDESVIVPLFAFYAEANVFKAVTKSNIVRIVKDTEYGQFAHVVTSSDAIANKMYATSAPSVSELAQSRINLLHEIVNDYSYEPLTSRISFWDLESSVYGSGIITYMLEEVCTVQPCAPQSIDTSMYAINPDYIHMAFDNGVRNMHANQLEHIDFMPLSDVPTVQGKKDLMLKFSVSQSARDLYNIAMSHSLLFPEFRKHIANMGHNQKRILKKFTRYTGSLDSESLMKLARNYVIRVAYMSNKGVVSVVTGTRCDKALTFVYGSEIAWKTFEGGYSRIKSYLSVLEAYLNKDTRPIDDAFDQLRISELFAEYGVSPSRKYDKEYVSKIKNEEYGKLQEYMESRKDSNNLLLKSVSAASVRSYYRPVPINNICAVEYSAG